MEPTQPHAATQAPADKSSGPRPANLFVSISKRLSDNFALDVEFIAPPGVTILFGASGSGKTTLLNCIAGLIRPDAGRVALGERVIFDSAPAVEIPVASRSIGYLFQNLALFPHLNAGQNIQYGLAGLGPDERRRRTGEIARSFRISHVLQSKPRDISGGERQRVALARSLVTDPSLLLLDEPLSALDEATKSKIIEDLRAWNAACGIPIIYVTHSHSEVFALGERVVVLEGGKVLAQGTPQQVLGAPRREAIAQIAGFENIFDARVVALRESNGTMLCRLLNSGVELEVPLTRAQPDSLVRVAVRAGDIMVSTKPVDGLSARNQFRGILASLQQQGPTVIASVDSGLKFEVHLTPTACENLQLRAGQEVWLIVKTYSCHPVA